MKLHRTDAWKARIKGYATLSVLILVTLGAFLATAHLPTKITDRLLEQDIRQHSVLWKKRVLEQTEYGVESFARSHVSEQDNYFLSQITSASDLYRFKMFNADGLVFWSSRESDIGSQNTKSYFTDVVMRGGLFYKHEPKDASEIDDIELHADLTSEGVSGNLIREVAEIYTPILKNGKVIGAIEFYTDITDLRLTYIRRVEIAMIVASAVGLALLFAITYFVMSSSQRQLQYLKQRSEDQHKGMEEQIRLSREVQLLGELNEWLQSSHSLEELFDMVSKYMEHMLPDSEGSVYVYSNSRDVLDGSASWNGGAHKEHIQPDSCWGLRRGRTYVYGRSEVDFCCEHAEPHDDRPYFCFPILAHGETVGLMHLRATKTADPEAFKASQKLAQMCAEQISMAIANVRMRDQLHDQSVRDALTGLYNRRHMTESLRKLIGRSQKGNRPLALVSVDVDHFKKFNDNHGHDAGDMVLRAVGSALENACDGDEVACRLGGEEFMLLLPDVPTDAVIQRAEALRAAIEAISVRYGEKTLPTITISIGISLYPEHGVMPQDLMRIADDALYEAKARGRNQIVVAERKVRIEPNEFNPNPDKSLSASANPSDKPDPNSLAAE